MHNESQVSRAAIRWVVGNIFGCCLHKVILVPRLGIGNVFILGYLRPHTIIVDIFERALHNRGDHNSLIASDTPRAFVSLTTRQARNIDGIAFQCILHKWLRESPPTIYT